MKKILLVCAAGMSTSLLVNMMKKEIETSNLDVEVEAVAKEKVDEKIQGVSVILLGPQIGYLEDDFKKEYQHLNIPIKVINSVDYGMMDAKKILSEAL